MLQSDNRQLVVTFPIDTCSGIIIWTECEFPIVGVSMKPRWQRVGLLYLVILIGGIALIAFVLQPSGQAPEEITLSEIIAESQNNQIETLVVEGEWITVTTKDGRELESYKGDTGLFEITGLILDGVDYGLVSFLFSCLVALYSSFSSVPGGQIIRP